MRSLVLTTAGAKGHGKSTFIKILTGVSPGNPPGKPTRALLRTFPKTFAKAPLKRFDPKGKVKGPGKEKDNFDEQNREMSLDLSFVHRRNISFIDFKGDSTLVKDLIVGLNHADGCLLFVSLKDGMTAETLTHFKLALASGITQILVVFTFSDSMTDYNSKAQKAGEILAELKKMSPSELKLDFWIWDTHLERTTYDKLNSFFSPISKLASQPYSRFFIDRAFEILDRGLVVTGTFESGSVADGLKCLLYAPELIKPIPVQIERIQSGHHVHSVWGDVGRVSFLLSGAKMKHITPGSFLIFERSQPTFSVHAAVDVEVFGELQTNVPVLVQFRSTTVEALPIQHPKGFWRFSFRKPIPLLRGDRIFIFQVAEEGSQGQLLGAGRVLDAYLPRDPVKASIPAATNHMEFARWVQKQGSPESLIQWSYRLGLDNERTEEILQQLKSLPPPQVTILSDRDRALEAAIKAEGWLAYIQEDDVPAALKLATAGRVVHLKDKHFLHVENLQKVVDWMSKEFETSGQVSLTSARSFFQVSRSSFEPILTFCEQVHLVFKKGNSWGPFKMLKTWDSSRVQPLDVRVSERRSVRPTSRY